MSCFAVFLKSTNKQIRVFHYDCMDYQDYLRAQGLAFDFARNNHKTGYPCTVEEFHMSYVGNQVLDTEKD